MKDTCVLVVEDQALIAEELRLVLSAGGYDRVDLCSTYEEALTRLRRKSPDACVLDLDLGRPTLVAAAPGEEGRRLLALLGTRKVPTVVYTAHSKVQPGLAQLHGRYRIVDKTAPAETVLASLEALLSAPIGGA